MYACRGYNMTRCTEIALAIIGTGNSKPEHINRFGYTALMDACEENLRDVALALIATGNSKPENYDENRSTALMHACMNSMADVAVALIKTGKSNPNVYNDYPYFCAMDYAEKNSGKPGMQKVIELLRELDDEEEIEIEQN